MKVGPAIISPESYAKDPCGSLSIPYWKHLEIAVPQNMRIVHARDYQESEYSGYRDVPYFRLLHSLKDIVQAVSDSYYIETAAIEDIPLIAEIINRSYRDISITCQQLHEYTRKHVYDPQLWIIAYDKSDNCAVGCGIADVDRLRHEGILEWIQVLPECRGKGIGRLLVNSILARMVGKADFATVSGKVNDSSCPERLYRKCGFTGDDIWHILIR